MQRMDRHSFAENIITCRIPSADLTALNANIPRPENNRANISLTACLIVADQTAQLLNPRKQV